MTDIDHTTHVLDLARRSFVTPCYLRVYDDEGQVLVEVADVHGRETGARAKARTFQAAIEVLRSDLERRGPATPMVCTDADSLCLTLERSIERARQKRGLPPIVFGDFPQREVK